MLVKYIGNADKNEGTGAISGLESGYNIPFGSHGEVTEDEYRVLSQRVLLEQVGDGWDALTKDQLEAEAPRLGVVLDGLKTKDEYVKAITDHRTQVEATEEDATEEPNLPPTATGSGPGPAVGGAGGAAGAAGSPPPGNAGAGGGRP